MSRVSRGQRTGISIVPWLGRTTLSLSLRYGTTMSSVENGKGCRYTCANFSLCKAYRKRTQRAEGGHRLLLAMQNQARLLRHTRTGRVGFPEGLPDLLIGILEGVGLNVTPLSSESWLHERGGDGESNWMV